MQEKETAFLLDSESAFANLKNNITQFAEQEIESFRSVIYQTNHLLTKQHAKSNFLSQDYSAQVTALLAQLEIYFSNLIVKITSFPLLGSLAKILQKIMSQYTRITNCVQEYWLNQHKMSQKIRKTQIIQNPLMEMCLHCGQNIRQQEVKQARFHIFNPIDDPYLFFSNNVTPKIESFQETRQKQLQDRLNQLANNMLVGQNCMREMIEQLANDKAYTQDGLSSEHHQDEETAPQLMPLLKSVFKHVRKDKTATFDIGVQANIVDSSKAKDKNGGVGLYANATTQRSIKKENQSQEKGHVRTLEEKIVSSQHQISHLRSEVTVLKGINQNLQKKNGELQLEVTVLKTKKVKQSKRYENAKSSIPKIDQKVQNIEQIKHQIDTEKILNQRKRRSYRGDLHMKKIQSTSPGNMDNNSGPSQNKFGFRNSRNTSKAFRQTDTLLGHHKASTSTNSIREYLQEDYVDEDSELQVVLPIRPSLSINAINERRSSHLTGLQEPLGDTTNSIIKNSGIKEIVTVSRKKGKQMGASEQFVRCEEQSQIIRRKQRRLATLYNRDELLRIIYEEETKNIENPMNYPDFKQTCDSVIQATIKQEGNLLKKSTQKPRRLKQFLHKKSSNTLGQKFRSDGNNLIKSPMLENISPYSRTNHNSMNFGQLFNYDDPNTPSSQNYRSCQSASEKMELPRLRSKLFINYERTEKKVVLERNEHQIMTELMAYLAQLKTKSKASYEAVRELIIRQDSTKKNIEGGQDRQLLQDSISQLINMHRGCEHQNIECYCSHLQELVNSITKVLD